MRARPSSGSSLVSSYWNGAATYYRGMIRALNERGHSVTFYEADAYERQNHRDIPDPEWAKVVVYPANGVDDVHRALEQARDADVIVKAGDNGALVRVSDRQDRAIRQGHRRFRPGGGGHRPGYVPLDCRAGACAAHQGEQRKREEREP